jgi:hypothetical protein
VRASRGGFRSRLRRAPRPPRRSPPRCACRRCGPASRETYAWARRRADGSCTSPPSSAGGCPIHRSRTRPPSSTRPTGDRPRAARDAGGCGGPARSPSPRPRCAGPAATSARLPRASPGCGCRR